LKLEEVKPEPVPLWWTEGEKRQAAKQAYTLAAAAASINSRIPGLYNQINWRLFRQEVLDKYRNNEYCHVDNERIIFLEPDKQTPASTVNFVRDIDLVLQAYTQAQVKVQEDDINVLLVQAQDDINIPPREKSHWEHYRIPVKFKLIL
jgi:hypothetical protein